jgi:hypothetical protein
VETGPLFPAAPAHRPRGAGLDEGIPGLDEGDEGEEGEDEPDGEADEEKW